LPLVETKIAFLWKNDFSRIFGENQTKICCENKLRWKIENISAIENIANYSQRALSYAKIYRQVAAKI